MSATQTLSAPLPYFGGKAKVAPVVWQRFGSVKNFVDPFMGSLAMLLGRPTPYTGTETVNDVSGLLTNMWRGIQFAPGEVAYHADYPVSELDLSARHAVLVESRDALVERLAADPDYCDTKLAGWYLWGACSWIGSGWCAGTGPWVRETTPEGFRLIRTGNAGQGINRQLPHLGDAGRGINRQLPHLGDAGRGEPTIYGYMNALSARLRGVRIACGNWSRVVGPSITTKHGLTAVYLDPPYSAGGHDETVYAHNGTEISEQVRGYCLANGRNPLLRIAISGYGDEHAELDSAGWQRLNWKAKNGYQKGEETKKNGSRETTWFSPHCLAEHSLFNQPTP